MAKFLFWSILNLKYNNKYISFRLGPDGCKQTLCSKEMIVDLVLITLVINLSYFRGSATHLLTYLIRSSYTLRC
jgi:hypothetical protein